MKYFLSIRIENEDGKHIISERLVNNLSLQSGSRIIQYIKNIVVMIKYLKRDDLT